MNPEEERLADPDGLPEAQDLEEEAEAPAVEAPAPSTENEELDDQALGHSVTADDAPDGIGEIDAMGAAAGLPPDDDKPFRGVEAVEQRDVKRWELDPRSAEDLEERAEAAKREPGGLVSEAREKADER